MTVLALALALLGSGQAAPPAVAALDVYPREVRLANGREHQSLVMQAARPDGVTLDVGDAVAVTVADPAVARFVAGRVLPVADGTTELRVRYGEREVVVPVHVEHAAEQPPVVFGRDVMPVFMKAGCNKGTCHGSARGQDGFRLSLFGFDPPGDYQRITRELGARRINLALPAESLLLEKGLGDVPHTGGRRFGEDSVEHDTLLEWLEHGAPPDPADRPAVTGIELLPRETVLEGEGATQRLVALATYADGTRRDVTDLAVYYSNNESSAKVDPAGTVTAGARGEAFVLARFDTYTTGSQVLVIPADAPPTVRLPAWNFIDEAIADKLQKLRIQMADVADDETFLRRATLAITGQLPTTAERREFLAAPDASRRADLVDRLLERPAFADLWVMKFSELLQMRVDPVARISDKSMVRYHTWLKEQLAANVPLDRIVRELLSASGGTFTNPPTNYYQVERDTLKLAENTAQVWLGMRIQCAQCHNHPFDRWTMDDYYGFAAFFSQVGRKAGQDPREVIVANAGGGEVKHPVTGAVMPPKFLGGAVPDVRGKDRRAVLAEWLTAPDNPWFARNLVNLVWAQLFGVGLIDPVDDGRVSNPPSHPALLDDLARRFVAGGYDLKALVRTICASRTWQLDTAANATNATDRRNFSRFHPTRLRAEVLLDVISEVTGTTSKFPGLPRGARAVEIADGSVSTYFLTTFGRASRATVCSCEVSMEPNLSQALHLLNGSTTGQRIAEGGVVQDLLAAGRSRAQVVRELYLRCFSREPTAAEQESLAPLLAVPEAEVGAALEDVFWALLNTKEFQFTH